MRIYEWNDFASDWSSGLAVVIAENIQHAREILWEKCCNDCLDFDDIKKEIYDKNPIEHPMQEKAFYVCGGG